MTRDKQGKFARRGKKVLIVFALVMFSIPIIGQIPAVDHYGFVADWYMKLKGEGLVYTRAEAAEVEVMTPDKIEEMKGDVLDRLKNCENKEGVALIWDTNNAASIGDYMFQIKTVQHYWLKKTGEKVSSKEAARIALDDVKARELAEWIIFEGHKDDKGIGNWFNCMNRHDLDTLVDFIAAHD